MVYYTFDKKCILQQVRSILILCADVIPSKSSKFSKMDLLLLKIYYKNQLNFFLAKLHCQF